MEYTVYKVRQTKLKLALNLSMHISNKTLQYENYVKLQLLHMLLN